jgi:hypothetical protein
MFIVRAQHGILYSFRSAMSVHLTLNYVPETANAMALLKECDKLTVLVL